MNGELEDKVWAFGEVELTLQESGSYLILSRATDKSGIEQPESDMEYLDGLNNRPRIDSPQ